MDLGRHRQPLSWTNRIEDPFFRLWFRVVASQRGRLASAPPAARLALLDRFWPDLVGRAWEDLCRQRLPRLRQDSALGRLGPWGPASRWWSGNLPEWDLVAESLDGRRLLIGEAKSSDRPLPRAVVEREAGRLGSRAMPEVPARYRKHDVLRALFVPEAQGGTPRRMGSVFVVTADDLVR